MAGMDEADECVHVHKEGKVKRMAKDEQAVQNIMPVLSGWKNPVTTAGDEPLSNIVSGLVAPLYVESDLLKAHDIGEKHLQCFINDCLITTVVPFHDRLPTLKLKTFTEMAKVKSV